MALNKNNVHTQTKKERKERIPLFDVNVIKKKPKVVLIKNIFP